MANGVFGVDGQYDFVRATFASDGSNVPRMPPMRVGGGAYWRQGENWFVRMGLLHAFGQKDLGVNDTPTAGYNLLKMEVSHTQWRTTPFGATEIRTGLVGDNLLDVDVRNSVQFHKDEILLPGRSIKFFMNAKFGGVPPAGQVATDYAKAAPDFDLPLFKAASGIGVHVIAVGTGQAVLDYVTDYVKDRRAFGEPIANRQAVAFAVANIAIELDGLRLATYRAAARVDQGLSFAREVALARRLCTDRGMWIGSEGVQLLGGHGYVKEHPVERWYRDLRAAGIMEGGLLV